jgi:hypothetical protein
MEPAIRRHAPGFTVLFYGYTVTFDYFAPRSAPAYLATARSAR